MPWEDDNWFDESTHRRRHVEWLAVMIIIIAVMGIVITMYRREARIADRTVCLTRLKWVMQAATMYADNYDGRYPLEDKWARLLVPYVDNLEIFLCPSDKEIRSIRRKHVQLPISYWYLRPSSDAHYAAEMPVVGDRMYSNYIGNHDNGGNVGYLDGHALWRTIEMWKKLDLPTESPFGDLEKKR